jgi:hypothetical protein
MGAAQIIPTAAPKMTWTASSPASNAASPLLVSSFCSMPYGDFYYLFGFDVSILTGDLVSIDGLQSRRSGRAHFGGARSCGPPLCRRATTVVARGAPHLPPPLAAKVSVLLGFFEFF